MSIRQFLRENGERERERNKYDFSFLVTDADIAQDLPAQLSLEEEERSLKRNFTLLKNLIYALKYILSYPQCRNLQSLTSSLKTSKQVYRFKTGTCVLKCVPLLS